MKTRLEKLNSALMMSLLLFVGVSQPTIPATACTPTRISNSVAKTQSLPGEVTTQDWHPQITLRVYNYAHIDPGFLRGAEAVATGILRDAKVDVEWLYCPLSQEEDQQYPRCPGNLGTNAFVLNILTPEMARRIHTHAETLGYALTPCEENATSCLICIFYFRVIELALEYKILPARLLGHVIAHELGHVLLGVNHSSKGIMRGTWGRNDLNAIGIGLLNFSTDEATQLRNTLLRRVRHQEVARDVSLQDR